MFAARVTEYGHRYCFSPPFFHLRRCPLLIAPCLPAVCSHGRPMSSAAAAQLMSVTLYYRRFFPYYAFCMIAGLDEQGKGAVYGYDAVGSFKRDEYGAMGSGQNFVMPILDNLIGHKVRVVAGLVDHRQTLN